MAHFLFLINYAKTLIGINKLSRGMVVMYVCARVRVPARLYVYVGGSFKFCPSSKKRQLSKWYEFSLDTLTEGTWCAEKQRIC